MTRENHLNKLKLKIPPIALVIIFSILMSGVSKLLPSQGIFGSIDITISILCVISGSVISLLGVMAFRRAQTTVNPMLPQGSSTLVTSGIYSISRNPMYVGFLLLLIGLGFFLSSIYSLMLCAVFVLYMNRFQIQPEEEFLESLFFDDYRRYKANVRRWC
ncbi:isoprenylcysteine carboxylmethyltransferase family protein [Photobacterium sp. SDRW27]|uniref:methyltransferase family protein n=1 Tax=Photobacterium obscurum TaxID=2829490 RepID=UPI002243FB20|nr:isoprenylcysteine carboxylmethyltransferase family protein [Photobacterium obscurum]MCW8330143.1 isoprenylcysteine carboxylmethyltransferase family protein [Photobacterium obscurum]